MEDWFVPHQPGDLPPAQRVLVLAPHPDDETFGCGGAIALYRDRGATVRVTVLTDGAGYEADADRAAIGQARQSELQVALQCLGGAEWEALSLRDRELAADGDLRRLTAQRLADFDPQVILAPSPWEVHPDHRAASRALFEALSAEARRETSLQAILLYEVGALQRPNLLVDVTAVWPRKAQAMMAFATQQQRQDYARHIAGLNTYRAYTLPAAVLYAEAYRVVNPADARSGATGALAHTQDFREVMQIWAQEALVAAESHAERAQQHLAGRERAWAQREHSLGEQLDQVRQTLTRELLAARDELSKALGELELSRNELAARHNELEAMARQHQAEMDALGAQLAWSRQEAQGLAASHEAARDRIDQLETDVRSLLSSTSWRVTAPLRWLSRKLLGRA